jgi:hypothetical protein
VKDFFVSYNQTDHEMAVWIAQQLQVAGYSTTIQARDMPPGSKFLNEMDKAIVENEGLIAVLSPEYLQSSYCKDEWQAFHQKDSNDKVRALIPVRVRECQPQGLLSQRVYIDLVGKEEEEARKTLLDGVKAAREKLDLPSNILVEDLNVPYPRLIRQLAKDETKKQVVKSEKTEEAAVGPNIVTAWFRLLVRPLLLGLRAEKNLLGRQKWTWRPIQKELEHISPVGSLVAFHQDSLVEFLRFHPELVALVVCYDEDRGRLIKACDQLQQVVEQNETFLLLYEQARADLSTWHFGPPINSVLLSGSDVEHRKILAQYIVNQNDELHGGSDYKDVWNKYRFDLLHLLEAPEINDTHKVVVESGAALLQRVEELIEALVEIRRSLSMQYDVPPES